MSEAQAASQQLGTVRANPIGLDAEVTVPICEGLNIALAGFQSLYWQYPKHHFVMEGIEHLSAQGGSSHSSQSKYYAIRSEVMNVPIL